MIQLQDVIRNISVTSNKKCDFCMDTCQNVSHHCKGCDDDYCSNCATKHQTSHLNKGYQPAEIVESSNTCSNHSRGFTMFCLDCNTVLCPVCVHQNVCCTGLTNKPLEDIKVATKHELHTLISRISAEMKEKGYQTCMKILNSKVKQIEDINCKIKSEPHNLRERVNPRFCESSRLYVRRTKRDSGDKNMCDSADSALHQTLLTWGEGAGFGNIRSVATLAIAGEYGLRMFKITYHRQRHTFQYT